MITVKIGLNNATVRNGGEWTFQDPNDRIYLDLALFGLAPDYHPDVDRQQVDALIATWPGLVQIVAETDPGVPDDELAIF